MTAAIAKIIPEAQVRVPPFYTVPVPGASEICVVELPTGEGLLTWIYNGIVRGVVLPSPRSVVADNVVAPDGGTVLIGAGGARRQSCFVVDGTPYLNVVAKPGATETGSIYIGSSPLSYSLLSTYSSATGSAGTINSSGTAGIPMVIGSRWILASAVIASTSNNTFHRMGVYTSTDAGASWTNHLNLGFYSVGGSYMHAMSGQVGVLPSGRLMVWGWGSINGVRRGISDDDGATWTSDNPASEGSMGPWIHAPVVNNGSAFYAINRQIMCTVGNDGLAIDVLGTVPMGSNSDSSTRAVWCEQAELLIYCHRNRVLASSGGWKIGEVGIG